MGSKNIAQQGAYQITGYKDFQMFRRIRITESAYLRIVVIIGLIISVMGWSFNQTVVAGNPEDIEGYWAEEAISALIDEGIISGYPDGTFKPENPVTRGEFAKMVAKAFPIRAAGEPMFSDIEDNWAKAYIAALTESGVVSGYPDGTFRPSKEISRAEMTHMLISAINLGGKMDSLTKWNPSFIDVDEGYWAFRSIEIAKDLGVIPLYFGVVFDPELPATRGETAYMVKSLAGLGISEGKIGKVDNQQGIITIITPGGIERQITMTMDTIVFRNNVEAEFQRLLRGDEIYIVSDIYGKPRFVKAQGLVTKDDITTKVSILSKGNLSPDDIDALAKSDWNSVREGLEPKLIENMVRRGLTEEEATTIIKQNWAELGELAKKRVAGALSDELGVSRDLVVALLNSDWEQAKAYGQIEVAQYVLMKILNL